MKKLRRPGTVETHKYMKERQRQNIFNCKKSKAEEWMKNRLLETNLKWNRQMQWGYRLFDFWNHEFGIAVEVDGAEHNKTYDEYRDAYNFKRSAIIVLRVRNFNETDADQVINQIKVSEKWLDRRSKMGLLTKTEKMKTNKKAKEVSDSIKLEIAGHLVRTNPTPWGK